MAHTPSRGTGLVPLTPILLLLTIFGCTEDPTAPKSIVGFMQVVPVTTGSTLDPDGYRVVVDGENLPVAINDMITVDLVEGTHEVELTDVAMNCQVAGDNPRVATIRKGETSRVTFEVSCSYVLREIAFSRGRGGDDCQGWLWSCNDLYVMGANGASPRRLTDSGAFDDDQPVWSPDGSRVLFTREDAYEDRSIYVMNVDGSGLRDLTGGSADSDPNWSPDGTRIAFARRTESNVDVFVMNVDGSGLVNLTAHAGVDSHPSWSPDGTRIAFSSTRRSIECIGWRWDCGEIFVMNVDGSGLVRLTEGGEFSDREPVWSHDGSQILFTREDSLGRTTIQVMDADGSAITPLTTGTTDSDPVWSPDGTRIAFARTLALHEPALRDTEVYVMALDGSDPVNITNRRGEDRTPAWLPALSPDAAPGDSR